MTNKLMLAVAMALVGAGLLVAAATASASSKAKSPTVKAAHAKSGGTLKIEVDSDYDYVDPQLDYLSSGWEMQFATQVKLFNFPDKNGNAGKALYPEGAAGSPLVSKDGKTYTFKIRPGFRFSNGKPVTARNYAYAIQRSVNPKMSAPGASFMTDILVGAAAYNDGKANGISGIRTPNASTLVLKLTQPAPDLVARMSMAFFSATDLSVPIDPNGVNTYPSAGPYYLASRTPERQMILKRNPYYKGTRPHNFDTITIEVGNTLETIQLNVQSGKSDYAQAGIPATAYAEVAQKFGVNRKNGQFFVYPQLGTSYLAMNHDRPLFKNNPNLAKAVNFATDRHALVIQAGAFAGKRNDLILPPGMAGYVNKHYYPTLPNFTKAKAMARGNTREGNAVLYTTNRTADLNRAAIYQYDLKQIGINVSVKTFTRGVQITKEGTRGEPFDLTTEGWIADYADPYDFVNILLDGSDLQPENNNNIAYYNNPKYTKQMQAAARLSGSARYKAYGALDQAITKNDPPWAVRYNFNSRTFVSKRIGCMTYPPGLALVAINALCLK
jgi:peptide/nickel transport system substrate-binding protein